MKITPSFLVLTLTLTLLVACSSEPKETTGRESEKKKDRNVAGLGLPRGVITNSDEAVPGYILFNPTNSASSYLLNRQGQVVHQWKGHFKSWLSYLMDNGNVIRNVEDPDAPVYHAGGMAGRIEELNWDGETLWEFEYATEEHQNHHDLAILPNGNILAIAWERKSAQQVIKAGRNPDFTPPDGLWMDKIIEIQPIKPRGGKIVWEWRFWDHLVQDFDPNQENYDNAADHPELLDINAAAHKPELIHPDTLREQKKKGLAHRNATVSSENSDVHHSNAINYRSDLDQIVFSTPHLNEIFIIDHSTSTEEAAGHTGGRWGMGGDFLYRWGNPQNYGRGDSTDQKLYYQHDVKWIEKGSPGESNLIIHNNAIPNGPDSMKYSAIYEISLPMDDNSGYIMLDDGTYGPVDLTWSYVATDTISFFSPFTSGTQRMQNGNTFIISGAPGRFFEVTPDGKIVWEYWTPYRGSIRETNGDPVNDGPFWYWQFRSTFIPADHPALAGKQLVPLDPQPDIFVVE